MMAPGAPVVGERLHERLSELAQCAMEIAMGNFDVSISIPDEENDILVELATALELMRQDISRAIKELSREKERVIAAQSETIQRLSAPALRIWDDILLLPLIGTVDTLRAQEIIEAMLDSISSTKALVVILDVTGVSVFDTTTAAHILRAVRVAKMLGVSTVLTGISPRNAQTLVSLNVDLSQVITKGTLHGGLEAAFVITKGRRRA